MIKKGLKIVWSSLLPTAMLLTIVGTMGIVTVSAANIATASTDRGIFMDFNDAGKVSTDAYTGANWIQYDTTTGVPAASLMYGVGASGGSDLSFMSSSVNNSNPAVKYVTSVGYNMNTAASPYRFTSKAVLEADIKWDQSCWSSDSTGNNLYIRSADNTIKTPLLRMTGDSAGNLNIWNGTTITNVTTHAMKNKWFHVEAQIDVVSKKAYVYLYDKAVFPRVPLYTTTLTTLNASAADYSAVSIDMLPQNGVTAYQNIDNLKFYVPAPNAITVSGSSSLTVLESSSATTTFTSQVKKTGLDSGRDFVLPGETVMWSLDSASIAKGANISGAGVVTVAAKNTFSNGETVVVTATSVTKNTLYRSVNLTINKSPLVSIDNGTPVIIKLGVTTTLPSTVVKRYGNGSSNSAAVTWSALNLTTPGVKILTGMVSGGTYGLSNPTLKVTVYDITSINTPAVVSTKIGTAPILPTTVIANYQDSSTGPVAVTWDEFSPSSAGTFTINGTVANASIKPSIQVTVCDITSINTPSPVSTYQGFIPILPTTVTANYAAPANGSQSVAVIWDAFSPSSVGTFTINGTVANTNIRVSIQVTVNEVVAYKAYTFDDSVNVFVDDGSTATVSTNVIYGTSGSSIHATNSAISTGGIKLSNIWSLFSPTRQYQVSAMAKAASGTASVKLSAYNGTTWVDLQTVSVGSDKWYPITGYYSLVAGSTDLKIFTNTTGQATTDVYIDNLTIANVPNGSAGIAAGDITSCDFGTDTTPATVAIANGSGVGNDVAGLWTFSSGVNSINVVDATGISSLAAIPTTGASKYCMQYKGKYSEVYYDVTNTVANMQNLNNSNMFTHTLDATFSAYIATANTTSILDNYSLEIWADGNTTEIPTRVISLTIDPSAITVVSANKWKKFTGYFVGIPTSYTAINKARINIRMGFVDTNRYIDQVSLSASGNNIFGSFSNDAACANNINRLSLNGKVYKNVVIANAANALSSASLIVAHYDVYGKLKSINQRNITGLQANKSAILQAVSGTIQAGDTVKAFVVDSLNSIKPITAPSSLGFAD